jgi:hypothetical protein
MKEAMCVVAPILLLLLWVALSVPRAGHDRRYDIERRQDGTLAETGSESWSQITARNAAKEDAVRQRQSKKQVLLEAPYRGLFDKPEIETVDGELVDDVPQLGSGAPQLPSGGRPQLTSGDDYAIQKKRQMRGW